MIIIQRYMIGFWLINEIQENIQTVIDYIVPVIKL